LTTTRYIFNDKEFQFGPQHRHDLKGAGDGGETCQCQSCKEIQSLLQRATRPHCHDQPNRAGRGEHNHKNKPSVVPNSVATRHRALSRVQHASELRSARQRVKALMQRGSNTRQMKAAHRSLQAARERDLYHAALQRDSGKEPRREDAAKQARHRVHNKTLRCVVVCVVHRRRQSEGQVGLAYGWFIQASEPTPAIGQSFLTVHYRSKQYPTDVHCCRGVQRRTYRQKAAPTAPTQRRKRHSTTPLPESGARGCPSFEAPAVAPPTAAIAATTATSSVCSTVGGPRGRCPHAAEWRVARHHRVVRCRKRGFSPCVGARAAGAASVPSVQVRRPAVRRRTKPPTATPT